MLEVEADFVEALLGDEIFAFGTEVTAINYGVNELAGVRAEIAAGLDAADAFEAEGIPDTAGRHISFVDEVEDGVGVALEFESTMKSLYNCR